MAFVWRSAPLPERCVEIVEEGESALESVLIIRAVQNDTEDDLLDPESVGAREFPVLEVDVVDDFCDLAKRGVRGSNGANERFKCAGLSLVREVSADHVEPQFASLALLLRIDEPKVRIWIDESANQPRRGDSVDVQSAAGGPDTPLQLRDCAQLPRRSRSSALALQTLLQAREQSLRPVSTLGAEEVDLLNLRLSLFEASESSLYLRFWRLNTIPSVDLSEGVTNLGRERLVIRLALPAEPADEQLRRDPLDELALGDVCLASCGFCLLDDPREVFEALGIARKYVNRVLETQGADSRKAPADLGAKV